MKKRLLSTLLVSLLAACAGQGAKDQPGATVEERAPAAVAATTKAATAPLPAAKPMDQNEMDARALKDPNNILSKRSV